MNVQNNEIEQLKQNKSKHKAEIDCLQNQLKNEEQVYEKVIANKQFEFDRELNLWKTKLDQMKNDFNGKLKHGLKARDYRMNKSLSQFPRINMGI